MDRTHHLKDAEGQVAKNHTLGKECTAAPPTAIPKLERPILTHCQVLGHDLIKRMASSGVIANVQPSFVPTDARFVLDRLPKQIHNTSYCWRSLLEAGVWVAGGSDAPVELPEPLLGIFDAMTRLERALQSGPRDRPGQTGPEPGASDSEAPNVFLPHECLPFAAALWMYTIGAAYAANAFDLKENSAAQYSSIADRPLKASSLPSQPLLPLKLGALAPGFAADFVVLDRNVASASTKTGMTLADVDPTVFFAARVDQTWVAGKRRFLRAKASQVAEKNYGAGDTSMKTDPFSPGKNGPLRRKITRPILRPLI